MVVRQRLWALLIKPTLNCLSVSASRSAGRGCLRILCMFIRPWSVPSPVMRPSGRIWSGVHATTWRLFNELLSVLAVTWNQRKTQSKLAPSILEVMDRGFCNLQITRGPRSPFPCYLNYRDYLNEDGPFSFKWAQVSLYHLSSRFSLRAWFTTDWL